VNEGQRVKITRTGEDALVLGTWEDDGGSWATLAVDRDGRAVVVSFLEDELEETYHDHPGSGTAEPSK
jgi:photosystem II stability/assembly factor-like uncharacterized protein